MPKQQEQLAYLTEYFKKSLNTPSENLPFSLKLSNNTLIIEYLNLPDEHFTNILDIAYQTNAAQLTLDTSSGFEINGTQAIQLFLDLLKQKSKTKYCQQLFEEINTIQQAHNVPPFQIYYDQGNETLTIEQKGFDKSFESFFNLVVKNKLATESTLYLSLAFEVRGKEDIDNLYTLLKSTKTTIKQPELIAYYDKCIQAITPYTSPNSPGQPPEYKLPANKK